jgi:hypothetical protein
MIASKISHPNPRFTIGIARLSPERGILMVISGLLYQNFIFGNGIGLSKILTNAGG